MLDYVMRKLSQTTDHEFVLSDGAPDRIGDIVEPKGWQIGNFDPVALLNHSRDAIIGKWENVRIVGDELRGALRLAEKGTSAVVDMTRALFEQGMLDAVSVGFRAIEKEPLDPKDPWGPQRFRKAELLEASLVSVPANPRARRIAKEFLTEDTYRRLLAKPARSPGDVPAVTPGKPAEITTVVKVKPMEATAAPLPIGKRIDVTKKKLVSLKDSLADLSKQIAEVENPSEEQKLESESLIAEIDQAEKNLALYESHERRLIQQVAVVQPAETERPFIHAPVMPGKRGDIVIRAITCRVLSNAWTRRGQVKSLEQVVKDAYRGDRQIEMVLKAAISPGATSVAGWAQELVNQVMQDFLDLLPINSIYPTLAGMGQRYTFGQAGIIKIPARASTPSINGSFIGEGNPIPVRRLGVTSITLTPKKMAVISEFTKELDLHSTPNIENVVRNAINRDTAIAIDTALIDTTAADTVRPAGIRNGVSGQTPSAASTTLDKITADLKNLQNVIIAAGGGGNLLLICNPKQALSLSMFVTANGTFPFATVQTGNLLGFRVVQSQTVPADMLIMVDTDSFASVTADTPEFEVSDQATLHEEDTTPLPISATGTPNTVAAPIRSLWQTYSVGIRMILPMNWTMLRTGMVSWVSSVTW